MTKPSKQRERTRMPALKALLNPLGLDATPSNSLPFVLKQGYHDRTVVHPLNRQPDSWNLVLTHHPTMTECFNHYSDASVQANARSWLNLHAKPDKGDGSQKQGAKKGGSGGSGGSGGPKGASRHADGLEAQILKIVQDYLEEGVAFEIGDAEASLQAVKEGLEKAKGDLSKAQKDLDKAAAMAVPVQIQIQDRAGAQPKKLDGQHHPMFAVLVEKLARGHSVLTVGPSGSGKTYGGEKAAEALELELFLMNPVDTRYDLLGHSDAGGKYHFTEVSKFATCDKPCLLLIDELDRYHARALTALNGLLSNGQGVFPDLGRVQMDKSNHYIMATANTWGMGANAEYVGALKQDAAVLGRFPVRIPWDYDEAFEIQLLAAYAGRPHTSDEIAAAFAKCVRIRKALIKNGIRAINWTPRDTMALGVELAHGVKLEDAFQYSVLAALTDQQRQKVME